jgi:hypothetical protein
MPHHLMNLLAQEGKYVSDHVADACKLNIVLKGRPFQQKEMTESATSTTGT